MVKGQRKWFHAVCVHDAVSAQPRCAGLCKELCEMNEVSSFLHADSKNDMSGFVPWISGAGNNQRCRACNSRRNTSSKTSADASDAPGCLRWPGGARGPARRWRAAARARGAAARPVAPSAPPARPPAAPPAAPAHQHGLRPASQPSSNVQQDTRLCPSWAGSALSERPSPLPCRSAQRHKPTAKQ